MGVAYLHRKTPFIKRMVGDDPSARRTPELGPFPDARRPDEMIAGDEAGKNDYRDIRILSDVATDKG